MKSTLLTAATAFIFVATVSAAQSVTRKTIYIEPQDGFETYLAAAIQKKDVPVDVVTDKSKAQYWLTAAPIEVHKETSGGKIARCLFAYCAGIEDRANVSVQLVESGSTKVVWAYSVNKGNGQKNTQSMAEATAKHLKEFLEKPVN
jgi:hypothetical protein